MNLSPRQPAGGQHTRLRPIDTVRPAPSPGTSSVPRVVGEDGGSMGDGRGGGDYFWIGAFSEEDTPTYPPPDEGEGHIEFVLASSKRLYPFLCFGWRPGGALSKGAWQKSTPLWSFDGVISLPKNGHLRIPSPFRQTALSVHEAIVTATAAREGEDSQLDHDRAETTAPSKRDAVTIPRESWNSGVLACIYQCKWVGVRSWPASWPRFIRGLSLDSGEHLHPKL